jgi:hypothetical protein
MRRSVVWTLESRYYISHFSWNRWLCCSQHFLFEHDIDKDIVRGPFFSVSWGGVKANLVGRPLIGLLYQPRMIDEYAAFWWNENSKGTPKYSEETCPSATLSTTNPAWLYLGSNACHRFGKLRGAQFNECYKTSKDTKKLQLFDQWGNERLKTSGLY